MDCVLIPKFKAPGPAASSLLAPPSPSSSASPPSLLSPENSFRNAFVDKPASSLRPSPNSGLVLDQNQPSSSDVGEDDDGTNFATSGSEQSTGDDGGSDCQDSNCSADSEDSDDPPQPACQPGLLPRKRSRKENESRRAPAPKKICTRAPKDSEGYPAVTGPPAALPKIPRACALYCAEKSHVDPSKGCPSTPISQCAILHKLRMYFGPHGFVCERCGHLYPPGHLRHHIVSKHLEDLDVTVTGKQKVQFCDAIIAHLLTTHGVPQNVASFDLPETVSAPIPGLSPPVLSFQCPICPNPRWFKWKTLRLHYQGWHAGAVNPKKGSLHPRFIIRPYRLGKHGGRGGRDELSDTVILLPEHWTPASSPNPLRSHQIAIPKDQPLVPKSAPHLVAIGWSEYLQNLDGTEVDFLMKLVELPKKKDIASFPPKRAALERGMLQVDALLVQYLEDANAFLDSCHPSVRKSITLGTKAHYRSLTRETYVHYRAVMTKTLCMLLRVHYFSRLQDESHTKRLGNFSITWNTQQASATKSLYEYLVSADGKDDGNFVARSLALVHELLVLLVHHAIRGTRKMECPTDQSLFLLSLKHSPEGTLQFVSANRLTNTCASLQYWFYTIVTHVARLETSGKDSFVFFDGQRLESLQETDTTSMSTPGESILNEGMELSPVKPKNILGELDDAPLLVIGADDDEAEDEAGPEAEADVGPDQDQEIARPGLATNILRVLHREKEKWLRTTPGHDYFTPYDRLKAVWYDAAPTAFKESAKIGFAFEPDGTTIIVDAVGEKHRINLVGIGNEARRIVLEADTLICQCLPEDARDVFASFPDLSRFSDDLNDPTSIFRQSMNSDLVEPAISNVRESLLQSFSSEREMLTWLKYNEKILSLFLVGIALTCGIPPRGFQFASLQFDRCAETGAGRGLFFINGCLAIGKPAAKQPGRAREESCLWFLPRALASCLTFYLAVLRPVVTEILTTLRKEIRHQDVFIFCRTIPRTTGSHSWNGDEITRMVQDHTANMNITLSIALLRQLYTAFFCQYFPGLCDPGMEEDALVDRQAQHRFYTGRRHYGQLIGNVPRSLGIDIKEARKLGAMSQLLHIVHGFRLPDEHWKPILEDAHFLPCTKHERHALDTARLLVVCEYGILSRGKGPPGALRAREVLQDRPYITLPLQPGDSFGDTVLVQVLHASLFGEGGPGQYGQTPPGGYLVADVARAVTLIIQALEEWASGNYQPVNRQFDLQANQQFVEVQSRAEKCLMGVRDRWPDAWCKLSEAARTYVPQTYKRDWNLAGLPEE